MGSVGDQVLPHLPELPPTPPCEPLAKATEQLSPGVRVWAEWLGTLRAYMCTDRWQGSHGSEPVCCSQFTAGRLEVCTGMCVQVSKMRCKVSLTVLGGPVFL